MKEYTAIYHTEGMKGIQYSFKAKNLNVAIDYCKYRLSAYPDIVIVENTFLGRASKGRVVWMNGFPVR